MNSNPNHASGAPEKDGSSMYPPRLSALKKTEKAILFLGLVCVVAFAAITVKRGAFLKRPMTDAQVFFRAAWAIQSDVSIFDVADDNGWHFHYPPTLAIALRPLANAPRGRADLPWSLSYPVSLFIWFFLGLLALLYAVALFGNALDRHVLNVPLADGFFNRWWLLRLGPPLAFLCLAGHSLGRGQVTTLLLLSMVGFTVAYADKRPIAAGLWLALGITIKIFPGILVLVPLVRRDKKCLGAIVIGCVVGLFVIPALFMGPAQTIAVYTEWTQKRLLGLASGDAGGMSSELSPLSYDMVGFGAVFARLANLILTEPVTTLANWTRWAHWGCAFILIGAILWAGKGRAWSVTHPQPHSASGLLHFGALIIMVSVPVVTVAQTHYGTLGIPLFMLLVAGKWRQRGTSGLVTKATLFGGLVWIAFLLTGFKENLLSTIGWLTFLLTGLILVGLQKFRQYRFQ